MFSNDKIIQNLKQSLFQDTEEAFNNLFGPLLLENESYNPDAVNIDKDIEIEDEPKFNFFIEHEPEKEEETEDDFINQEYSEISKSYAAAPKKKKTQHIMTSKRIIKKKKSISKKSKK